MVDRQPVANSDKFLTGVRCCPSVCIVKLCEEQHCFTIKVRKGCTRWQKLPFRQVAKNVYTRTYHHMHVNEGDDPNCEQLPVLTHRGFGACSWLV